MIEKIVQFGPKSGLIGILTEPKDSSTSLPAFIFVNSGLLHRIGPFRIYVSLSRKFAKFGYHSMRIDLSGKGDSLARKNSATLNENVKQDIKDAMDYLQNNKGINQFVICGICTGADNAYEIGFNDDRVVGIIPVDGYAYPTIGFKFRHFAPKLFNLVSWSNLIKRIFKMITFQKDDFSQTRLKANYRMIFPPIEQFKDNMTRALNKNKNVLVVYTGGWKQFYNYEEQFADCLPEIAAHKNLQLAYNASSDHTFILRKDKEWLIDNILNWANSLFSKN